MLVTPYVSSKVRVDGRIVLEHDLRYVLMPKEIMDKLQIELQMISPKEHVWSPHYGAKMALAL